MLMSKRSDLEIEKSFVIFGEHVESVLERLRRMDRIGPYALGMFENSLLLDEYFDLPDHQLQWKRLTIRIRTINESKLITLKGPTFLKNGVPHRVELERIYSEDSVQEIVDILRSFGIRNDKISAHSGDPANYLKDAGFSCVQARITSRLSAKIDVPPPKTAVLVLDKTTFVAENRNIHHHEIEIEASDGEVLRKISGYLRSVYKREIADWDYGKFVTIQTISEFRDIENYLTEEAVLRHDAYMTMKELLESKT
jgi:uncharacterized protein YjbK